MEEHRDLAVHVQGSDGHQTKYFTSRAGVVVDAMPVLNQGLENMPAAITSDWMNIVNFDAKSRQGTFVPPALVPVTDLNQQNGSSAVADISVDLLDQQQSREQAKLLQRFKQLKEWQKQQQEKLIRQQREQLHVLQSEQQRVQSILAAQRQKQWGGGINVLSPGKQKLCVSNPNASGSPSNGVSLSTGPVSLKVKSSHSPSNGVSFTHTMQPHLMQNLLHTLPSPRESQPSDLDSTGEAPHSDVEDGFYPLPETSSEMSFQDVEDRQRMMHYNEDWHDGDRDRMMQYKDEDGNMEDEGEHLDISIQKNNINNEADETIKNMSNIVDDFDNQPVTGNGKQFEELLEQQLRLEAEEESTLNSKPSELRLETEEESTLNSKPSELRPKRTFLKKGQGISRFGMKTFHLKKKAKEDSKKLIKSSAKQVGKDVRKPTKKKKVPTVTLR